VKRNGYQGYMGIWKKTAGFGDDSEKRHKCKTGVKNVTKM